jgi:hypothetical protein
VASNRRVAHDQKRDHGVILKIAATNTRGSGQHLVAISTTAPAGLSGPRDPGQDPAAYSLAATVSRRMGGGN